MDENKNPPNPKRLKRHNRLLRLLALLVTAALVLGAMILVIYRDTINLDAFRRWMAYQNIDTGETGETAPFSHAGGDKLAIAYLDSGVVAVSASGARYYTLDGQQLAEEVHALENPVLTASPTTAVAYDAGNQALFAFRGGEESFKLDLEGGADLLSARPNEGGWMAVTAQQSGYKGAVTVYDRRGEPVIQISLSSTFVVDAAVSPDGQTVAVVTIGQSGGAFFSRLLLYRVNQKEPFAQVALGSLTVLDMDFDENLVWLVGEDRLVTVSLEREEEVVRTYYFAPNYLKGCSLGGDGFAFVLVGRYRSGGATQALRIDGSAQVAQSIPLTGQVLDYSAAGSFSALLTGGQLSVYDGSLEYCAGVENSQGARHVALSANGSAVLANDQRAWLYIP